MPADHVVIIGASLAGLRTAEGLRRAGHAGPITIVGDETALPYTRPPLSKQVLTGEWEPEKALLRPQDKLDELDLAWHLGSRATALDTDRRVVAVAGAEIGYDALVVATGSRPRPFPGVGDLGGVHVLRTLSDSLSLRADLAQASNVVVIGGGFIGAEVACAARERGLAVTIVEPLAAPMIRGLGAELGAQAAALIVDHGVDLRLGIGVDAIVGSDRVSGVALSDGTSVAADLVVVGIGALPNVEWLEGSGVTVDNGVVCDDTLAAVGVDGVWAAGDVARWHHPTYGEAVRFEHWTVAADHGQAVAKNIVAVLGGAAPSPHAPVPYVWSDQFGRKIQIIGRAGDDDEVVVLAGDPADHRFLAVRVRDGEVTGAVAFSQPRLLVQLQMRMEQGALTLEEARGVVGA